MNTKLEDIKYEKVVPTEKCGVDQNKSALTYAMYLCANFNLTMFEIEDNLHFYFPCRSSLFQFAFELTQMRQLAFAPLVRSVIAHECDKAPAFPEISRLSESSSEEESSYSTEYSVEGDPTGDSMDKDLSGEAIESGQGLDSARPTE